MSRWDSLNPTIKSRIVKEAQDRAIRNKKRREPASEKKRRLYDQYREMQVQSKRDRHVERPTPVNSKARSKLSDIAPGEVLPGRVISLTNFRAYVDVNSEVDGLLHVNQITRDEFVEHPRAYLSPVNDVEVRVVRLDSESKKLQLTMLPENILEEENVLNKHEVNEDEDDRIQLDEIEVDDELWGEIRRVTDYGAYVEIGTFVERMGENERTKVRSFVATNPSRSEFSALRYVVISFFASISFIPHIPQGAVCRGFLHFMDHPVFGEVKGPHPREYMRVGDRVRVWVMDVERTQKRIKLTANRPAGLPGPRREVQWI